MDNAPVHSRLEELLQENPHTEIIRPAPYSYLLNPIELLFSIRVEKFRSFAYDQEHFFYVRQFVSLNFYSFCPYNFGRNLDNLI